MRERGLVDADWEGKKEMEGDNKFLKRAQEYVQDIANSDNQYD